MNKKVIVFYDSWCPFCIGTTKKIKKLDIFRNISFKSLRIEEDLTDINIEKYYLEKRMHAINKKNQIVEGIDAFILISKSIPFLWLLFPFLIVFKKIGLGQSVYDFVARRRTIIPVNQCNDDCLIK